LGSNEFYLETGIEKAAKKTKMRGGGGGLADVKNRFTAPPEPVRLFLECASFVKFDAAGIIYSTSKLANPISRFPFGQGAVYQDSTNMLCILCIL
jgi:hypothetical protein